MNAADTNAILNSVIVLLNRSLAVYLADARPWMGGAGAAGGEVIDTLKALVTDQNELADRLSQYVIENKGDVAAGEFPMAYTALHDLSLDFCLKKLLQNQQDSLQFMQQASAALETAPMAKALVDEAMGAARGHCDSLKELLSA